MTRRPYSQTLQQAYRDTLGTPGAPEAIDDETPVVPVAVVAQVTTAASSSFVKVTDGTDTQAVNGDGSINAVPYPHVFQKMGNVVGGALNNSGVTVYTVTATKTFYLTSLLFSLTGGAGITLQIKDGSTVMFQWHNETASAQVKQFTFPTPIPFTSSVVFFCTNTTTQEVVTAVGYEV